VLGDGIGPGRWWVGCLVNLYLGSIRPSSNSEHNEGLGRDFLLKMQQAWW